MQVQRSASSTFGLRLNPIETPDVGSNDGRC